MNQDYVISYWLRVDGQEIKGEMIVVSSSQKTAQEYVKSFIANDYGVPKSRVSTKILRVM